MDLYFNSNYDGKNIVLIESNQHILDYIENNNSKFLTIKGESNTILCTENKSFELKFLETSNTFFLLENEQTAYKIIHKSDHTLETNEVSPKKYNIINLLRTECALNYDFKSGESNINHLKKYTILKLFEMSDLCFNDYNQMIENFMIFQKDEYAFVFKDVFLHEIITDILKMISKFNIDYNHMILEEIFSSKLYEINENYLNIINQLSNNEKETIMKNVSDKNNNFYSLNVNKVKLFCAKTIFNKKEITMKLSDFVILLNRTFEIIFPFDIISKITDENIYYTMTECEDNLYEYYKDYDLRFLKGYCFVFFLKTQRDALIQYLDITDLPEKFENRLNELYTVKDKWSLSELASYLRDFNISNVEERLQKYCKQISEINLFDSKRNIIQYTLKIKL